jgi:hypothetical protein
MPRPSTLVILLATVVLYALGLSGALPVGIFLAMGLELVAWKRAADRAQALRPVRVARPMRDQRGRRR